MGGAEKHWNRGKLKVVEIAVLRRPIAIYELALNLVLVMKLESLHSRSTKSDQTDGAPRREIRRRAGERLTKQ
jgi:hypothetical protein